MGNWGIILLQPCFPSGNYYSSTCNSVPNDLKYMVTSGLCIHVKLYLTSGLPNDVQYKLTSSPHVDEQNYYYIHLELKIYY